MAASAEGGSGTQRHPSTDVRGPTPWAPQSGPPCCHHPQRHRHRHHHPRLGRIRGAAKNSPITVTDVQSDGRPRAVPGDTHGASHASAQFQVRDPTVEREGPVTPLYGTYDCWQNPQSTPPDQPIVMPVHPSHIPLLAPMYPPDFDLIGGSRNWEDGRSTGKVFSGLHRMSEDSGAGTQPGSCGPQDQEGIPGASLDSSWSGRASLKPHLGYLRYK
eukprot:scaffold23777_cov135-Isochrysis_galbana.AAC.1